MTPSTAQRVTERHARDEALRRLMAEKVAEAELFDAPNGHAHTVFAQAMYDDEGARRRHNAVKVLGIGGILFGVGAVTAGVGTGLLVANTNDGGVEAVGLVMITVGAALGLAGIITLIVGAVLLAVAPPSQPGEE